MRTFVNFSVYEEGHSKSVTRDKSLDVVLSPSAFKELCSVIDSSDERLIENTSGQAWIMPLSFFEDGPCSQRIFDIIFDDSGKRPSQFVGVGALRSFRAGDKSIFNLRRKAVFDRAEIEAARFLMVLPEPELAYLHSITNEECLVVRSDARLKNRRTYGALFPSWHMAVSAAAVPILHKHALKGLRLKGTTFSNPNSYRKEIFQLTSDFVLPRSELTVCDNHGNELTERNKGCFLVAETDPPILKYQKRFLDSLDFDIASTVEVIGAGSRMAAPYLVVSQRFRSALAELGCGEASYQPVELTQPSGSFPQP
jgi:hypothetical protein